MPLYRTKKTFIEPTRSSYCINLLYTFLGIEVWKQIKDYPNHDVSNMGNVRHFKKGTGGEYLRPSGYVATSVLPGDNIKYDRKGSPMSDVVNIHTLVAKTFIPTIDYTNDMTVDHKNNIKDDNRLINLEFATKEKQRANQSYPESNSTNKNIWKCDIDGNKLEYFESVKSAAKSLLNSVPHISATNMEFLEIITPSGKLIRSRTPSAYHYFFMDKLSGRPIPPIQTGPCRRDANNKQFIKSETETRSKIKKQWDALSKNEKEFFKNMEINAKNKDLSLPLDKEGNVNYVAICSGIASFARCSRIKYGYKWVYDENQNKEHRGEVWATVPSKILHNPVNEYEVSTLGRIRQKNNKKIIKGSNCSGYRVYGFRQKGNTRQTGGKQSRPAKTVKGHRIVALTFLANPENKPVVDHINENKQDNRLENLRWLTHHENKIAHEQFHNRVWTHEQEEALRKSVEHTPRMGGKINWSLYTKPEILKNRTKKQIQGRLRHFHSIKNRDTNISNHMQNINVNPYQPYNTSSP